ncbi:hypothetical protein AAY473_005390 [Plecturocebus cupreus]
MLARMVLISWPRDPPALASQSAGITGVSHRARPTQCNFLIEMSLNCHLRQGFAMLASLISNSLLQVIYLPHPPPHNHQSAGITDEISLLLPRLDCNGMISANCNFHLLSSNDSPASVSRVAEITAFHSRCPGWNVIVQSWLTATSVSKVHVILLLQPPEPDNHHSAFSLYTFDYCAHLMFCFCCPGWSAVAQAQLTATSTSWVQAILPQAPEKLELQANTTTSS